MKYKTKSVLVTRMPRVEDNEFKTASIKLFSINNAHKTEELPVESFEYPNIEKIVIKGIAIDYYLEGNDLIINNLSEINIEKKDTIIELSVPSN